MFTGSDLRKFRESREWSLRQFSTVIGVSVKTIQVIEKENKPVPLQMRLALAAIKAGVHPIEPNSSKS
ncbi:MAG: helix-turn-helix transcriptional regulator [Pseudomonadota bacterium]